MNMKDQFLIKYNKAHRLDAIAEKEHAQIAMTLILIDVMNRDQMRKTRTKSRVDNIAFETHAMCDSKEGYNAMINMCV